MACASSYNVAFSGTGDYCDGTNYDCDVDVTDDGVQLCDSNTKVQLCDSNTKVQLCTALIGWASAGNAVLIRGYADRWEVATSPAVCGTAKTFTKAKTACPGGTYAESGGPGSAAVT